MKRRISRIVTFVAICLFAIIYLAGCAKTVNLKHTGFEEGSKDSIKGWILYDYHELHGDPLRTIFDIVPGGVSGNCLKIESKNLNDARVYQEIKVKRNTTYKITVYVKTENVEEGAGVNISAIDCADVPTESVFGTNSEWQELTVYAKTGPKQRSLQLSLGLGGYGSESSGVAYFDNVSVEVAKKVPQGARVLNVEPRKSSDDKDGKTKHETLMQFLFITALASLLIYIVALCLKSDKENFTNKEALSYEITRPGKRDWIIIGVMTLVCALFSYYKLGDMKAASNYWKVTEAGEYVIVEFDSVKNVRRIAYSCNIPATASYRVLYEDENGEFKQTSTLTQKAFFEWEVFKTNFTTKRVKIEARSTGLGINEVGFFETDEDGNLKQIPVKVVEQKYTEVEGYGKPEYLFDEQDTVPVARTYMNGTYFDEVYFPRTAYEHIHGLKIYETTHPPMGKNFIALGIKIFGMNPFGWRFMGTLAGVLLVPIMYLFALKLFKKRFYAFIAAFLMMFDFMRLAQTRLATIDSYSCLFVLLMYYFMYDYFVVKSYDLTFRRSLRPLIFAGLAFGLGAAAKWTSLYAGAGLALLFFLAKYAEAEDYIAKRTSSPDNTKTWWLKNNFLPTCLACVVLFVVIPGIIYVLSYIPYIPSSGGKGLWDIVIDNQKHMYKYHANLNAKHSFGSPWWSWPIMVRPIWYFIKDGSSPMRSTIVSFGNPAIWWVGIVAIGYTAFMAWKKRDKYMIPVIVGYGLQYFPWILVTRVAFIYHYFTAVPFMILMIVYAIKNLLEDGIIKKSTVWLYLGVVLVLFVMYYPVLTGLEVKRSFVDMLKIFSTWVF